MDRQSFGKMYATDRRGTSCLKYDFGMQRKGREDLLPLWVADMDFKLPKEILDDFHKRINHGVFGSLIDITFCGIANLKVVPVFPQLHKCHLNYLPAVLKIVKIPVDKVNEGVKVLFKEFFKFTNIFPVINRDFFNIMKSKVKF